jgi:hypothetical protein
MRHRQACAVARGRHHRLPEVKDPHTILVDRAGIVWFPAPNANQVGRLDRRTGAITLLTPPTAQSRPYGMAVSSKGTIFDVVFGTNKVAAVDPRDAADQGIHATGAVIWGGWARPREGHRVSLAEPGEVAAVRHFRDQRRRLVQRDRHEPEHRRALRSQDRDVPELVHPGRRRHRAQRLGHPRRRIRARQQPRQCRHAGEDWKVSRIAARRSRGDRHGRAR